MHVGQRNLPSPAARPSSSSLLESRSLSPVIVAADGVLRWSKDALVEECALEVGEEPSLVRAKLAEPDACKRPTQSEAGQLDFSG